MYFYEVTRLTVVEIELLFLWGLIAFKPVSGFVIIALAVVLKDIYFLNHFCTGPGELLYGSTIKHFTRATHVLFCRERLLGLSLGSLPHRCFKKAIACFGCYERKI